MTFLAVVILAATGQIAGPAVGAGSEPFQRGEDLFTGRSPLQGKPRDHRDFLPPPVVRCANCHATAEISGKLPLDGAMLKARRQRRHGPPSVYDETTFCKLLNTGIDPAYVMIDHAMPIYQMPAADCAALWDYLTLKEMPRDDR